MSIAAIIAFIFVFGLLVTVHEFGHFIMAKKNGVLVREFAIGMGPKLLSWNRNHTAYVLRLLPVGGYVRMAGTDEEPDLVAGQQLRLQLNAEGQVTQMDTQVDQDGEGFPFQVDHFDLTDDLTLAGYRPDSDDLVTFSVNHQATIIQKNGTVIQIAPRDTWLQSAKVWRRLLINFAGPFMNFVLALVLSVIFGLLQSSVTLNEPVIGHVEAGMPAQTAGIKANDVITSVNGQSVKTWVDFANKIADSDGKTMTVDLNRGQEKHTVKVKAELLNTRQGKQVRIGITAKTHTDLWSRLRFGVGNITSTAVGVLQSLQHMITGHFSLNQLGGPVMIARYTSEASRSGFLTVLALTAALSINLGIINLLPIPPLDGGKLLIDLIEGVIRRPVPSLVQNALGLVGAGLLVLLMIAVTINDILR